MKPVVGSAIPSSYGLGERQLSAEIQITPMIDVMMALLIIFMVITPVLSHYAALPPDAVNVVPETLGDAVTLGIDHSGVFYVNENTVPRDRLAERLQEIYRSRPGDHLLYLRADRDIEYRIVLDAIDAARTAGVRTIGAISLPLQRSESQDAADEGRR